MSNAKDTDMTKVSVISDGYADQTTAETLIDSAKEAGAAEINSKLNGLVALFENETDAEGFRQAVLDDSRLKGKLAGLSICPA